ncbi:MAG: AAA family ATPase [Arcicella sp.]|nr:AAA family ATPase [Arcicella sp.]
MNEKLIVKNFGPIKDAELELKKVTVFIGPQGSGKSTLAKSVAICKDSEFLVWSYIGDGSHTARFFEKFEVQYFAQNLKFEFENSDYRFNYRNNPFRFNIKIEKPIPRHFFIGENPILPDFESYKDLISEKPFGDSDLIPLKKYFSSVAKNHVIYIPTDRLMLSSVSDSLLSLLSADISLKKSFIDFGKDFETARKNLSSLRIDFLDIQYFYQNGLNLVIHQESGTQLPLSASSSGQQSVVPLQLVVEHFFSKLNATIIVEEPELNLFPDSQKQLIGSLVCKTLQGGKGDNELLMTTHSPYVLTALNNLIFAYQVAQVLPERAEDIAQIIPREQWLNPDDVAAYYVGEDENGVKGGVHSIFNKKTGLIGQNELDEISEELGDEFDSLMNIYRTRKRETVN